MTMPRGKSQSYTVDGRAYDVAISAGEIDEDDNVRLRISIQAAFGRNSVCLMRGITNRSYWHDYPCTKEMRRAAVSIAPRQVFGLIKLAHASGWDPERSCSNFELVVNSEAIRTLGETNS